MNLQCSGYEPDELPITPSRECILENPKFWKCVFLEKLFPCVEKYKACKKNLHFLAWKQEMHCALIEKPKSLARLRFFDAKHSKHSVFGFLLDKTSFHEVGVAGFEPATSKLKA